MLRFLIADDHPVVRQGLIRILSAEWPQATIVEACDASAVNHALRDGNWELVTLDLRMPGSVGLELLKQIKDTHPRIPILILSAYPEEQYARRSLHAGASGYLTKDTCVPELIGAVRRVLAGGRYISPAAAELLANSLTVPRADLPPHERLSDREYTIFCALASGKAVTEIASLLALSVKTVSTYRTRLLKKTGMRSNAEIIHYAVIRQLVDPNEILVPS